MWKSGNVTEETQSSFAFNVTSNKPVRHSTSSLDTVMPANVQDTSLNDESSLFQSACIRVHVSEP